MRKILPLFSCAVGLQLCCPKAIAQPSVYSGVFAFGSGDLNTVTKQNTITNFVSDAQKDVSIINMFNSWTSGTSTNGTVSFPATAMDFIRGHGSIPLFSWQPQNSSLGTTQSFTLANIMNGVYDPYITNWATAARNWGHPFFLRLAHEMNGNWYPWCAGVNGNTASQYVKMWRHVHDLFTGVGATNVTWVWCVNTVFFGMR
jgi:beta-mannanase